MLFNSAEFFIFLFIIYGLYLSLGHRWQNRILLAASYFFYGCWDWRFLSLIAFSTVVDYFCAIRISETTDKRRRNIYLWLSMAVNLGLLAVFKYLNFFVATMQNVLWRMGLPVDPFYLSIVLPMGISFYTFQTMSYTIDVHRGSLKATRDFWDFALYVSFFPQLVAGPIERASHLLPQVLKPRKVTLDGFYEGCFLIGWGLFQKVFIADNLAMVVDPVFSEPAGKSGLLILAASYAFTYQIYCDFAGYSNVARGLGKLMGFDIMINFNLPYYVTNIQDFWNRWHISLSTWLRDYLYLPLLRGLRGVKGNLRMYAALMITMVLIGFWHGAAWNFIVFGFYYGLLLIAYTVIRQRCSRWVRPKGVWGQRIWRWARVVFMYHIIVVGMLIFRASSVRQIVSMLATMATDWHLDPAALVIMAKVAFYAGILVIVQVMQYRASDLMVVYRLPVAWKAVFYSTCMMLMLLFGNTYGQSFIYFQF